MEDEKVLALLSAKQPRRYQKADEGYFNAQARWLERWQAYRDAYCMAWCGRPLHAHVYTISHRYTGRLVINTYAEAEDAYYAVCSGTFALKSLACYRAAVRIATALKPYASPETVKLFPISGIEKD